MIEETRGKDMYCSVLFVDMVGYSKRPNAEQIKLKQKFVSAWEKAISSLPREDIMVIDSGDGAAMTALKDAKDTLRVAKILLSVLRKEKEDNPTTSFQLRLGINFGPVEVSTNVHGQACIVGDAINSAARVMGFASANQLLVSHTYYEMVRPLLEEGEDTFYPFGTHKDKHGRPHELYEFVEPGSSPTAKASDISAPAEISSPPKAVADQPSESAPAEQKVHTSTPLPASTYSVVSWPFRWIWGMLKSLLAIAIVFFFIYEMIVLVPILNKPDALSTELGNQAQSARAFFHIGKKAIKDVSQSSKGAMELGTPKKQDESKNQTP